MFGRLIDAICDRIRAAVFARLSAECDAADGCGSLQVDTTMSLPLELPDAAADAVLRREQKRRGKT